MLLTDKAKEDFLKYVGITQEYFSIQDNCGFDFEDTYLNALIIEWLDSVDIIIEIHYGYSQLDFNFFKAYINEERTDVNVIGRNEATQQAIIKANEIYNNLNTKKNEK